MLKSTLDPLVGDGTVRNIPGTEGEEADRIRGDRAALSIKLDMKLFVVLFGKKHAKFFTLILIPMKSVKLSEFCIVCMYSGKKNSTHVLKI